MLAVMPVTYAFPIATQPTSLIRVCCCRDSHATYRCHLCQSWQSDGVDFQAPNSCNYTGHAKNIASDVSFKDNLWLESLQYLFAAYNMSVRNDSHDNQTNESVMFVSGGLQQYLIRHRQSASVNQQQPTRGAGSDVTTFHDIPESIQLYILSFLDTKDLCRISAVCRHWDWLSCDEVLWQKRLKRDVNSWHIIGHTTNPAMYRESQSDWSSREIYLRCSPLVNQLMKQENFSFHQLSTVLRSLWPKKTPKLAMFGPGLESSTSLLVRQILQDKTGSFKTTGMFPGQFEGLGSGFTLKTANGVTFNLTTLYTAPQEEREGRTAQQRQQHNRMAASAGGARPGDDGAAAAFELRTSVKDLCRTLDGFVFVIDATTNPDTVTLSREELFAMIDDQWSVPSAPLLVLSCTPSVSNNALSCLRVVELLQLQTLRRPWQVHHCVVDTMNGATAAFEWAVETCHRN